ncbi:hypothetical protein HPP92_015626 [Vanilla planifolia]|uniref:Uncharacterized protein n=1 Tax=Vanilla planifolia TaxID=51239 RepID=A0A835US80_VANPL|nr:hypothetical protein HPP92_015626 [Vanilla planifolia]
MASTGCRPYTAWIDGPTDLTSFYSVLTYDGFCSCITDTRRRHKGEQTLKERAIHHRKQASNQ